MHAIGLGCPISHAGELIYAEGIELSDNEAVREVGVTCRLCEREDCEQRVLPSLHRPLRVLEDMRGVSMYTSPED